MDTATKHEPLLAASCEMRADEITRQLYATDASIYQETPQAVAFPKGPKEVASAVAAAAEAELPVIPRGAGTGLTGGAIGPGLVIDHARYNRRISDLDVEARTVRVEPGVVLDQLNAYLAPHGLVFGPDVATSSRATLGGMIGNNSSGARAPLYGTTADHIVALDLVLPDGSLAVAGAEQRGLEGQLIAVDELVERYEAAINERFPEVLVKRWPGYGLDRYLRRRGDLTQLVTGSEGTLACVTGALLHLAPLPKEKAIGVVFFDSVTDAMQATVELLDLGPAAIEHVDKVLLDQTEGQLPFKATRALLGIDEDPCEALLIVEFYDDVDDKLAALEARNVGRRTLPLKDPAEMAMVWAMRKAGLSLLTGRKGPAKPIAGLEDVAVRPEQLPDYVKALSEVMDRLGMFASFYGHAASGLLHVRPVVDLHEEDDIERFRTLASEVSQIVRDFKGSIAAEHGVGIARTEYMEDHLGADVLACMRGMKDAFDPKNRFNPAKIFHDGTYAIDSHLRWGAGHSIPVPFEPMLAFAAKDGSFAGNLEQCNGCGGCRKDEPTMCPTYVATGEEIMSTRGRANILRAVLEHRIDPDKHPLDSEALDEALGYCLSCKACTTECPSNVNMALLKAETYYARIKREGVSLRERLVSNFDALGRLGCAFPALANTTIRWMWVRKLMERTAGFTHKRPLPPFAKQRFDHWFKKRRNGKADAPRGRVLLWDDCFVRYNEPHIGQAAVKVLETAGYEVALLEGRRCCGRTAFSVGRLDVAKKWGEHNVALIREKYPEDPIVFLEPSCYSMFHEDYRELKVPGAAGIAERCNLFEHFLLELLEREPEALEFDGAPSRVAIHSHCHAKSLTDTGAFEKLAERMPGAEATALKTGCCGMAGVFGQLKDKYETSLQVAEPLIEQVNAAHKEGAAVVASGTSCRSQVTHLSGAKPLHMAEVLAEALTRRNGGAG